MYCVKKDLKIFSAAHRLIKGYVGKCKNLHGHNYKVSIKLCSDKLDGFGFVIDFNDIKALFDSWVQDHWDHATLVCEDDHALIDFLGNEKQKFSVLPGGQNTTVEALTGYLFDVFASILKEKKTQAMFPNISIVEVTIFESETASATYVCGEYGGI